MSDDAKRVWLSDDERFIFARALADDARALLFSEQCVGPLTVNKFRRNFKRAHALLTRALEVLGDEKA